MDQLPVEIKIDEYWNSQLHALLIFQLYLANPAFYYISAGLARSFSHGDVSMMLNMKIYLSISLGMSLLKT